MSILCVLSSVVSGGSSATVLTTHSGRRALVYLSNVLIHSMLHPLRAFGCKSRNVRVLHLGRINNRERERESFNYTKRDCNAWESHTRGPEFNHRSRSIWPCSLGVSHSQRGECRIGMLFPTSPNDSLWWYKYLCYLKYAACTLSSHSPRESLQCPYIWSKEFPFS